MRPGEPRPYKSAWSPVSHNDLRLTVTVNFNTNFYFLALQLRFIYFTIPIKITYFPETSVTIIKKCYIYFFLILIKTVQIFACAHLSHDNNYRSVHGNLAIMFYWVVFKALIDNKSIIHC